MQHPPLLANGDDVVTEPVNNQTGGESQEKERKHDGENHHDLLLARIHGLRRKALLQKHRDAHNDGRNVEGVPRGQVDKPEFIREGQVRDKIGVPELNRGQKSLIQAEEHGHLNKQGETAAGGVHEARRQP